MIESPCPTNSNGNHQQDQRHMLGHKSKLEIIKIAGELKSDWTRGKTGNASF